MTVEFGEIGYDAYAEHQDWKNAAGDPLPPWVDVEVDIQDAWNAAVMAILKVTYDDVLLRLWHDEG